jgi:hypothetical protein
MQNKETMKKKGGKNKKKVERWLISLKCVLVYLTQYIPRKKIGQSAKQQEHCEYHSNAVLAK